MINLALALGRFRPLSRRLQVVPPRLRQLQVSLREVDLLALCRDAAQRDETLPVYLVPYVSFRAVKQHLPMLALFAPAWERLGDRDLTADLGATLDRWGAALRRRDTREARRWMLLAGAYLRMAGAPAGETLWQSQSDGLSPAEFDLAAAAVAP